MAKLVAAGHLRVMLTTNFDRLMEQAVQDEGIAPTVISTPSQAEGAMPFHHAACTIVKLHGDYLDTRIKNTPDELASYDPTMKALLDRVVDEHGLIICGWSAAWDQALRESLEARKGRRFSSYWADVRPLGGPSADLARHLGAQFVEATADRFFRELADSVKALEDRSRQHPATSEIAVGRLKSYIVQPADRIRLNDLVMEEVSRVHQVFMDKAVYTTNPKGETSEAFLRVADSYVNRMAVLMALGAHGGPVGRHGAPRALGDGVDGAA